MDRITHLCLNASDWTYTGEISVHIIFEFIRKCVALTSLSINYPMNIPGFFGFNMPHQVKKTLLQLYSEQLVEINIHCAYQALSLDSWVQFSNLTTLRLFEFQTVNNQSDLISFTAKSPKLSTILLQGEWNMVSTFGIWDSLCGGTVIAQPMTDFTILISYFDFQTICTNFTDKVIKMISRATHNHALKITLIVDMNKNKTVELIAETKLQIIQSGLNILQNTLTLIDIIDKPWLNINLQCAEDVYQSMTDSYISLRGVCITHNKKHLKNGPYLSQIFP
ncbi:MAG: hypothetical protein GY928_15895 [Colwellia sp.]|nr:hypothetical protein [Colwellia sp.]